MSNLTSLQQLDRDVWALCSFEYTPATVDSRASVVVTSAAVAGHDIEVACFHPAVVAMWEQAILLEMADDLKEAA